MQRRHFLLAALGLATTGATTLAQQCFGPNCRRPAEIEEPEEIEYQFDSDAPDAGWCKVREGDFSRAVYCGQAEATHFFSDGCYYERFWSPQRIAHRQWRRTRRRRIVRVVLQRSAAAVGQAGRFLFGRQRRLDRRAARRGW